MLLNVSYYNKNKYIYGLGWGSEQFPIYKAFYKVEGVGMPGHATEGLPRQCYRMHIIIRNINIYNGLGVEIGTVSEILSFI